MLWSQLTALIQVSNEESSTWNRKVGEMIDFLGREESKILDKAGA